MPCKSYQNGNIYREMRLEDTCPHAHTREQATGKQLREERRSGKIFAMRDCVKWPAAIDIIIWRVLRIEGGKGKVVHSAQKHRNPQILIQNARNSTGIAG